MTEKVTILNLGKDVCRWKFDMKFKTKDASRVFHLVTQFVQGKIALILKCFRADFLSKKKNKKD